MPKIRINKGNLALFADCVEKFIEVQITRNLSNHTLLFYRQALDYFVKKTDIRLVREFNQDLVERFISGEIKAGAIKRTSINTYLRGIRVFAKFLFERGYADEFPITLLKEDEVVKEPYTEEECRKLTSVPASENWVEWRNWAASCFLLGTGVRLNTLTNLKIKDLDFSGKKFFVSIAKNRHQCFLPLSNAVLSSLKAYLGLYDHKDEDFLFPTQMGLKIANRSFEQAFRLYCISRGVRPLGVHRMRHTFCSNLCKQNVSAFKIQKLMGHKDMQSVQKYIHIYATDIEDYESVNPLDRLIR